MKFIKIFTYLDIKIERIIGKWHWSKNHTRKTTSHLKKKNDFF